MLVELTYACSMNCTHCLSDCKPDGQHMTTETLEQVLGFMVKHRIPTWNFSGGEMFENPDIIQMLSMIETARNKMGMKPPVIFITNGRKLVRNKDIYNAVSGMQARLGKKCLLIQVTDDPRFYPDPLTDKERYWLKKLGAIVEPVPSNPADKESCLYPQGRALSNFPDAKWNTIGPKCANCILIARQKPNANFTDLVNSLFTVSKVCTPVIAPDGSIKIGESALCPAVATIQESDREIMEHIRNAGCRTCKIPWQRLKETNPLAYEILR